jgi:hypothetical protein
MDRVKSENLLEVECSNLNQAAMEKMERKQGLRNAPSQPISPKLKAQIFLDKNSARQYREEPRTHNCPTTIICEKSNPHGNGTCSYNQEDCLYIDLAKK